MYACMYVCICTYICLYIYIHMCMCISLVLCICTSFKQKYTQTYRRPCLHTYVHIHTHTAYMHMYICTYTYIQTYLYVVYASMYSHKCFNITPRTNPDSSGSSKTSAVPAPSAAKVWSLVKLRRMYRAIIGCRYGYSRVGTGFYGAFWGCWGSAAKDETHHNDADHAGG